MKLSKNEKLVAKLVAQYELDALLPPFSKASLDGRYYDQGEKSPQDALVRASLFGAVFWTFEKVQGFKARKSLQSRLDYMWEVCDHDLARNLYAYSSQLWFMYSTPILSNGGTHRGQPISCFLNYVDDSREGLTGHYTENAWLSSVGGGVGGTWSAVRSNGTKTKHGSESSGVIPFMKVVDAEVLAFAQGGTRRASYAAYLNIRHPEIVEFMNIRKATGGDENRKCLNLHNGVVIPDDFMRKVVDLMNNPNASDDWDLVDPHSGNVVQTVSVKQLWQDLLELRMQTGEPYLMFEDAVNRALPESQKALGLKVHHSNLCTEITLPTNEDRTAVCCLSSTNLDKFDEWKNHPTFIQDLVTMLDNTIEYFILAAPDSMAKAKFSAQRERSIGLGAMGFHSYLQRCGVPFESPMATGINLRIFNLIKSRAQEQTVVLARERGACPDAGGQMVRNMHLLAIAPNASSSIICGGVSPSCEPYRANAFTQKTMAGSWLVKNPHLVTLLESLGQNTEEVWEQIITNEGSVQGLDFLSEHQKETFKTATEIDQRFVLEHAAKRGELICQGQSTNIFLPADVEISYLSGLHVNAWSMGLKTLYYLRHSGTSR